MSKESFQTKLDAVFKRDDLRGLWPQVMDCETALLAAQAFTEQLSANGATSPTVVVGYDARTGSPELAQAACRGIRCGGGQPTLLGLCSSEQVYFACGEYADRFAGGIMVTASHNPAQYNGMKFVLSGGAPLNSKDLQGLRERMTALWQPPQTLDLSNEFATRLLELSGIAGSDNASAAPIKVVIGAGNGVGAHAFAPLAALLEPMGFRFSFLDPEPDGTFPNGVPNPLQPAFMNRLGEAVRKEGAALGVGFDGDADRAGFVDETGAEIIPAIVYALVAQKKISRWQNAGVKPIVMRNLCCSQLHQHLFDNADSQVINTPVGHGQIKQLMRHDMFRSRVVFAGEHSGHYFYPEFFSVDSGMLTSLYILQVLQDLSSASKRLSDYIATWRQKYCWSGEQNWDLAEKSQVYPVMSAIWEHFAKVPGVQRLEVRADADLGGLNRAFPANTPYDPAALPFPDLKCILDNGDSGWWFVVRPSGNEPRLRLNVEAWGENCTQRCQEITTAIHQVIS